MAPTNRDSWRARHRIGGVATPTGRACDWFAAESKTDQPACSKAGFVETQGFCADHYLKDVVEVLESELRDANERWLMACDAEACLKPHFKCSCGLVTDLFALNNHIEVASTHHQVYDAPKAVSVSKPVAKAPKRSTTIEEIG